MNQQFIYLHGFASSPQSRKAVYIKEQFSTLGIDLLVPDLNQNDFSHLSLTRQIRQVSSLFKESQQQVILIGSSFGGLTATWLAQEYPQVTKLILLAPAFGFPFSWLNRFTPDEIKQWQEAGYKDVYHYGANQSLPLHYEFLVDGQKYPLEKLTRSLPTLIIHGKNDSVVPIEVSQQYTKDHFGAQLLELDSDHGLNDVQAIIWQQIQAFVFD